MTLSALIRKRGTGNLATAIPAISATQPKEGAGTVARIATVAITKSPQGRCYSATVALLEDPPASPAPVIDWEAFEERAAIMEYDGGLTREEAERKALAALGLTASPASPTPDASANLNRPSLAPPIADPNLDRALGVLNTLYRQHVARLAAGGHGPRGAMVHRSDYFKALRKARMASDTAFELLDQGQVETDSDGLYWVPIPQEGAP